jgi:endo-alpha-1,4-polygalactosaminidase (GH114 family)
MAAETHGKHQNRRSGAFFCALSGTIQNNAEQFRTIQNNAEQGAPKVIQGTGACCYFASSKFD